MGSEPMKRPSTADVLRMPGERQDFPPTPDSPSTARSGSGDLPRMNFWTRCGMVVGLFWLTGACAGPNHDSGSCDLPPPPAYRSFPSFLEEDRFDTATLAITVNHYVKLGEPRALADLMARGAKADEELNPSRKLRVAWVARILFGTSGKTLRPPSYGAFFLPHLSMEGEKWPLYPLVHSGDSYFVMSEGYILAGVAEPTPNYLRYCRENGRFRQAPVPVPTRQQSVLDLERLQASRTWKEVRWKENQEHIGYEFHSEILVWNMTRQLPPDDPAK
jgi:hypothetical protein